MGSLPFFLLLVPCVTSIAFYLLSIHAASRFFSGRSRPGPEFLPLVSILKSLCGLDRETYENLASFCRQDYPRFQLLLGVHDERDPVIPVLRRLALDFPRVDIQIIPCGRALGANPKVNNLLQMQEKADHPFLLVCDSDVRVEMDYLRRVVRPMADPAVGAVTCMCRSMSKGWAGALEALHGATEFCPGVLTANRLEGMKFGLGAAILVRREALQRIGGFTSIADYLADDYLLGNKIAKAGYAVRLSDVVVEHDLSLRGLRALFQRQIRWNRGIRVCRPWGYRGLLFTYGVPMSLALLFAGGGSAFAWGMLGAVWIARLAMAHLVGAGHLHDRAARKFLWLVPLQDLFSFGLWLSGLFGVRISWRGHSYRLTKAGKLIPLEADAPALSPTYDNAPLAAASQ